MAGATPAASRETRETRLPGFVKLVFGLGDHTINVSLSALSLYYAIFLTDVAGVRPGLAGAVLLTGRFVDAFTDPAMGRISDATTWRLGRRRPYFLLGMIPFGVSFALLWSQAPFDAQLAKFAYYVVIYVSFSVCSTVLAVPYMSLLPELTSNYQERTSINTYRSALAVSGTLLAATTTQWLAEKVLGGGTAGYALMGGVAGTWLALPWLAVYAVTWERPEFQRAPRTSFAAGLRSLARHDAYRRLAVFYLFARVAVDVIGAMLVFFFAYWLLRRDDVRIALAALLLAVVVSLPIWLRLSRHFDRRNIFLFGVSWWIVIQMGLLFATPEWSAHSIVALAALAGVGYAVADMMPWAMLGDVIDEDELASGERREGIYTGWMTFLRKLGGAGGVFLALLVLDLAGYDGSLERQSDSAVLAIRLVTALVPAFFLALAGLTALGYPIGRARHREILDGLEAREAQRAASSGAPPAAREPPG